MTQPRKFDLNMDEVLEDWDVSDALREIIANALDEQALTDTKEVEIFEDEEGNWHIRDYGRGLNHRHLIQDEDEEKKNNPDKVIGKFGVGLKDALATFYRQDVEVAIYSSQETIEIGMESKRDFADTETLHGLVYEPQKDLKGTEIVLQGVTDEDIEKAKNNFLKFTDEILLEKTKFGEVYQSPEDEKSKIYISGLKVAEEENFLFSYNIDNTTKKVREALNRERSNVGRSAYSSRVKDILKECESQKVAEALIEDFQNFSKGSTHDEVNWKPIRLHAVKLLNSQDDVVFATVEEQKENADLIDHAQSDNYRIVDVPETIRDEIKDIQDSEGEPIKDLDDYELEFVESHEYEWVNESELTDEELKNWKLRDDILNLLEDKPEVNEIRISETIRKVGGIEKVQGVYEHQERRIVIKRSILSNLRDFAGTLLHESAHAVNPRAEDLTRDFELTLTDLLGQISKSSLEEK